MTDRPKATSLTASPAPAPADAPTAPAARFAPRVAALMGEPPPDVARLLQRHGCALPRYYDVQQLRAAQRAHARWPLLDATAYGLD